VKKLKCKKCGEELTEVNIVTLEQNMQPASLSGDADDPDIDYGEKEPVECSAVWTEVECNSCSEVLLHMKGDGDNKEIIKLLKG
jgi:ribosomal protein S27E